MRLVEEKDELGFIRIANFGQHLEQFGQHPQQEGGIKPGRGDKLIGSQDVDAPCPAVVQRHQVIQVQRRFTKQQRAALIFQHQQPALDRADRCGRDIAVAQADRAGVFADENQKCLQVLQIQQRQTFFVRQAESDVEHTFLRFGQLHQARQQQWAHVGHGGADRVALYPEEIPKGDRKGAILQIPPDCGRTFCESLMALVGG